jgi:hypothetical protein
MSKRLAKAILDYVKRIDDEAYFDRLLERWSTAEIARVVVELTAGEDHHVVLPATLFARDGRWRLAYAGFHERLVEAGFLDALVANLSRTNYVVRRDAVQEIGRLLPTCGAEFVACFPRGLEHDPLLLNHLLVELPRVSEEAWERRWSYVERMIESPSYLIRWAAIEVVTSNECFRPDVRDRSLPPARTILRVLIGDADPRIRTEAAYRLRELEAQDEGRAVGPGVRRHLRRSVQADEPPVTFLGVRLTFENYLWSEQIDDYDLDLLDAWVRHREQHPSSADVQPNRDAIVADYRRFTRAYESGEADGATAPG